MKLKGGGIRKIVSEIIRKGMENKTEIIDIPLSCTRILFTDCSMQDNKTRKVEQMVMSMMLSMEQFLPLGKEISDKHSNSKLCMVGEWERKRII